jgi:hypothetical protein
VCVRERGGEGGVERERESTYACPPNVKGQVEEQWLAGLQVYGNASLDDSSMGPKHVRMFNKREWY